MMLLLMLLLSALCRDADAYAAAMPALLLITPHAMMLMF